ncbi:hypothetical protein [Cellvibrio sp. PSBB006]|uniref:hypothetical protein n=1 Tax=Cellvibrio sp. PSBB006 TaxID=1987723 RepID=UPI001E6520DC|nr:hypothetical protein [Cellvibrio sp. PSBB006]
MNLTDFQLSILERAAQTRGAGGFSAKSCRRHIERAWLLKESMPEVAVFLAITAEEEAATALFHAFQKKRYKNIGRINKRNCNGQQKPDKKLSTLFKFNRAFVAQS